MSDNRIRNIPSTASSKQSSQQSSKKIEHSPTSYQLVLSQFCNNQKREKHQKSVPCLQSERSLIHNLQQQIIELTKKVDYLTQENKTLKQNRVNSLDVFIKVLMLEYSNQIPTDEQLQQAVGVIATIENRKPLIKTKSISIKNRFLNLNKSIEINYQPLYHSAPT
ncbi:unnamed protein product (macronuclear) [Paramecium tetraurelia]|uniref:BHLH domain-containing protein n=1 Tax=Paramecium tetraurelia TaxID=5888 RepID=A0EGU1_PARTE|nr:uncharacterized protein GSPATT00026856001 [Paramecium tetraurelia]CAK94532.1 unnamed protein product [Paramecium tetraurelia]|eukprot:XP_001461905.1 hypothetical protein (macronuclear) [Paramecium tetraurelia strain d4-2]